MPLSISNSRMPGKRHVVLLILVGLTFYVTLEALTTRYFARVSQMESRRQTEYRSVLEMQRSGDHRRTAIMVIGNSLLLEGVNFPQLQQSVGPGYELRRLAVENTAYLDWYYGLRHIFRIGSRPDVVALFLNPIQLTSATMNGDY